MTSELKCLPVSIPSRTIGLLGVTLLLPENRSSIPLINSAFNRVSAGNHDQSTTDNVERPRQAMGRTIHGYGKLLKNLTSNATAY